MRNLKRKMFNLGLTLILAIGLVSSSWMTLISEAASCTFSVSGGEVNVGDTITLTFTCTEEGATLITYMGNIVYDSTYLEYQGDVSEDLSIVENDGFVRMNLTFKALKVGTTTVKFEVTDDVLGQTEESAIVVMTGNSNPGIVTITEQPTEAPTDPPTEAPTEATTEESTEATTEESTEATTEESTEATTEESTEATIEAPTVPPTEAPTMPPETLSSNGKLDALSVSPGKLSPAFSTDVHWYDVYVDNDVTVLNVDAVTSDEHATWVVTETRKDLKVGKNYVGVKVTAQDGSIVWYEMYVYRAAGETEAPTEEPTEAPTNAPTDEPTTENAPSVDDPLAVVIGSVSGKVQMALGDVSRPEGFEQTTYNYNGVEIEALDGIGKDLLLIPVSDGTSTKLYIYNEENGGFYPYVGIQVTSALYTALPFAANEAAPAGYSLTTIDFQGTLIDAWVRNDAADKTYAVFYAMNWDGETALYRYDAGEKTLQRVTKSELAVGSGQQNPSTGTEGTTDADGNHQVSDDYLEYYEETLKRVNRRDTFMFILMVVLLICMIAMYLLFVVGGNKKEDEKNAEEEQPEEEDSEEEDSEGEDESEEGELDEEESTEDEPAEDVYDECFADEEEAEVDEELQHELADIQVEMADFMADMSETEEKSEEFSMEDLEDDDLEDLDLNNIE